MKLPAGFTLIELLLVVSIIVVITGSMIPGFSNYIDRQGVKQAQEQIKSDVRLIQNRAISNVAGLDNVGNGQYPKYWGIRFTANSDSYTYFISDVNTACLPTNNLTKGVSTKFASGVVAKQSMCVFFKIPNGDISSNTVLSYPIPLVVGRSDGTYCRRIDMYQNGLVDGGNLNESCTP